MRTIAIVGGGPRGISVLERLGNFLRNSALPNSTEQSADDDKSIPFAGKVAIHLIDNVEPGAGRVWRTDQSSTLCMNTLADAVTLFTEPGSTVCGPILEGPTLYEWFQLLRGEAVQPRPTDADSSRARQKMELFREFPPTMPAEYEAEIRQSRPESHPSRALYGHYLRWVFTIAVDRLRAIPGVTVNIHKARAVDIRVSDIGADDRARQGSTGTDGCDSVGGPVGKQEADDAQENVKDIITLSDGTSIDADATILALGWTDTTADTAESMLDASVASHRNLTWIHPGHPADQDLDHVADRLRTATDPAQHDPHAHRPNVIVRGLGMGFFDLMARLTIDRGGEFQSTSSSPFELKYMPSGREPRLIVTSRHGYPYQPKPVYGSLPPAAPMPRLKSAVQALPSDPPAGSIDFSTTLWPAILRDAQAAYYHVLLRDSDETFSQVVEIIDHPATDPWSLHHDSRLDGLVEPPDRFDLTYYADPMLRIAADLPETTDAESAIRALTGAVKEALENDLTEALRGRESAVKAGLQVIGAARKTVAIADEPGKFTPESRRADYAEFVRIGANVGSGPPAFRTAELIALIDAGLVVFAGADPVVRVTTDHGDEPQFVLTSPTTGVHPMYSTTLIDAWQHKPSVNRSADPLTQALVASGRMRPFVQHRQHESSETREEGSAKRHPTATRSPEVNMETCRVIHPDGAIDPRVHMLGIPLQEMRADTTISPMPGTDPLMLQETDAAAASALGIVRR